MEKPDLEQALDDKRLWIGNLDPRVSEYHLLKLIQKHGAIEKFDLLFHRNGPLAGQPRGYAFVTFLSKEDAVAAKLKLNNMLVGTKNITVTWAHIMSSEEIEKVKPEINIPALAMAKPERKTNREFQIQAIEAKLKLMEHRNNDELVINKTVATETSVISQFQHKQPSTSNGKYYVKRNDKYSKPYNKQRGRR